MGAVGVTAILMTGGSEMGFMDGVRRGRNAAIAESKAAVEAARERQPATSAYGGCRVHGRRYDGCPLDRIEIEVLRMARIKPTAPRTGQVVTDNRRHAAVAGDRRHDRD